METRAVYQTLEDRNNPNDVEQNGPFICAEKNAWLGAGYYFWDTFVENAHWWGKEVHASKGYVICKASYVFDVAKCWDLTSIDGIVEFKKAVSIMSQNGLKTEYVVRIIEHLKTSGLFVWEAVRASPIGSRASHSGYNNRVLFREGRNAHLELCPPVQICFYSKTALNLSRLKIIYPDAYVDGYLA